MARQFGEVAEKLRRSTVRILTQSRSAQGSGSGVIWPADGTVITNAHVVNQGPAEIELWDGSLLKADVAECDSRRDLATLKINSRNATNPWPSLAWRDSTSLHSGEPVIAIGNPLGFVGALTTGTVRACGPVRGWDERNWVQASIRLAPGNSGGPLADSDGRLVGINTMVISSRGGSLGLAVPSDAVVDFLRHGPRPSLGVVIRQVESPPGRTALLVLDVTSNSPADNASLKTGDLLISANGRQLGSAGDLGTAIDKATGSVLKLGFLRGDRRAEREVAIALPASRREVY
jgi:serine protease Do